MGLPNGLQSVTLQFRVRLVCCSAIARYSCAWATISAHSEKQEERERVDREAEEAVIKFIKEEEEERQRQEKRDEERLQKIRNDIRRRENWEREQRERDERIRERDRVIRGGGNPNDDIMSEMTLPKLKF